MTIRRLITQDLPPLLTDDTIERALALLLTCKVPHLPIIDQKGQYVGLVSEIQLLEALDAELAVSVLVGNQPVHVGPDAHPFEAARLMHQHGLSILPVANEQGEYAGLITQDCLFERLTTLLATHVPGAILTIELDAQDYALSHLTHIFEQSNVEIRSIVTEALDSLDGRLSVTVKVSTTETARLRHLLAHYGYRVTALFCDEDGDEDLEWRLAAFLHYLEM